MLDEFIYKPTKQKVKVLDFDIDTGMLLVEIVSSGVKVWARDTDLDPILDNPGNSVCWHDWDEYDSFLHRMRRCFRCKKKEYL